MWLARSGAPPEKLGFFIDGIARRVGMATLRRRYAVLERRKLAEAASPYLDQRIRG